MNSIFYLSRLNIVNVFFYTMKKRKMINKKIRVSYQFQNLSKSVELIIFIDVCDYIKIIFY